MEHTPCKAKFSRLCRGSRMWEGEQHGGAWGCGQPSPKLLSPSQSSPASHRPRKQRQGHLEPSQLEGGWMGSVPDGFSVWQTPRELFPDVSQRSPAAINSLGSLKENMVQQLPTCPKKPTLRPLIAHRQSYRQPRAGTVKGVNATERKNYVENKGSYSCFKTFSQLGLRAFNQLFFFFLLQVLLSAKHLQREKETKEKREKQF